MRTRVKICGITHLDDALAAVEEGANAIGFVFSPSPRQIDLETAQAIIRALPPLAHVVGVFVNEPVQKVREVARLCGLTALQFQGDESNAYCQSFSLPVIKGFRVESHLDPEAINAYEVAAYLLDAHVPGQVGGTGHTFDWSLLCGKRFARPVIVAGGLHDGNVADLIRQWAPAAVDVSSGVAQSVRRKDARKIRRFMHAVAYAVPGEADPALGQRDLLRECFDQKPLVEIKGLRFLLNSLTEQVPATPAALLHDAASKVCAVARFPADIKLVGEEDKGGALLAAVSLLSGLPYGIARWYPSGIEGQVHVNFDCEYTSGGLFLNGVERGDKVFIVDDLISTGGTLIGLIEGIRRAEAEVMGIICVAEKINYGGVARVQQATGLAVQSLVQVDVSGARSAVVSVTY